MEQINQRPGISINGMGNQVYRGDRVELTATADDPEGHLVRFTWRAYACTDGTAGADCDVEPFYTQAELDHAEFDVPLLRENRTPVRNVRVVLEAKDDFGATAKPAQELVITALDRPPSLALARQGTFILTPNRPVAIFATVGDIDDGPEALGLPTWEVFAPTQITGQPLVDRMFTQNPNDPAHRTYAKTFTPNVTGEWEIRVTATDPLDQMTTKSLMLSVVAPPPPCIAQVSPMVAPAGAALPITETTLFKVPVVTDDLDVWPPQQDPEMVLDVTKFQWSLQAPGAAAHVPVSGATASSFQLDPATFTPGDIVEVRVEIYDRQLTPVGCPDSEATCSTISMPSCIQRQTWRVEVR